MNSRGCVQMIVIFVFGSEARDAAFEEEGSKPPAIQILFLDKV